MTHHHRPDPETGQVAFLFITYQLRTTMINNSYINNSYNEDQHDHDKDYAQGYKDAMNAIDDFLFYAMTKDATSINDHVDQKESTNNTIVIITY